MIEPKISLIFYTYRAGGFDLLVHGLKRQSYKNYELIIVDDYKNRNLSDRLLSEGLPLRWYGNQKKKTYPDTPFSISNIMNTGVLHSTGQLCVFVQDYTYLPREALEYFVRMYNIHPDAPASGVGVEMEYTGDFGAIGDYSVFKPEFNGDFGRFVPYKEWIPESFEFFYCAIPITFLAMINGIDEYSDYHCDACLYSFIEQCNLWNQSMYISRANKVFIVNHRSWNLGGDEKLWSVKKTAQPNNKIVDYKPEMVNVNNNFNLAKELNIV